LIGASLMQQPIREGDGIYNVDMQCIAACQPL